MDTISLVVAALEAHVYHGNAIAPTLCVHWDQEADETSPATFAHTGDCLS